MSTSEVPGTESESSPALPSFLAWPTEKRAHLIFAKISRDSAFSNEHHPRTMQASRVFQKTDSVVSYCQEVRSDT